MKNLKIFIKLMFAFGSILLATFILGITALVSIQSLNKISSNFVEVSVPSVSYLWTARRAIQATEKMALETTVVMTEEELKEIESTLMTERNSLDQALKDLLAVSPQFQSQVDAIEDELVNVSAYRQQILDEAYKFTTEGNAKAYELYRNEYHDAFEKVRLSLVSLTQDVDNQIAEDYTNALRTKNIATAITFLILVIAIAIIAFYIVLLTKQIVTPVRELEQAATLVSQGQLETEIHYEASDEIGLLAASIRTLVTTLKNIIHDVDYLLDEMAGGDFTVTSKNHDYYIGDFNSILVSLRKLKNRLSQTLQQIDISADQVNSGGGQVSSGAQALAQGATEQASTIKEISYKIEATAEHAKTAKAENLQSHEMINTCSAHMSDLMNAMGAINDKSKEIGKVIKTIEDIAFQTNILALNAAVEAARAGSAGKGFAVVADEVRNLATKSQEASKSSAALIEETVKAVDEGSRLSEETDKALQNVVDSAQKILDAVSLISDATEEQSFAVSQVTTGIDQISSVVQTNSATAEESAAASEELSSQANILKDLVGQFRFTR